MSEPLEYPDAPEWLEPADPDDLLPWYPYEHLRLLGVELDIDVQLVAIRDLIRLHREHEKRLSEELRSFESALDKLRGIAHEHAINEQIDQLHRSTYHDAAHSMSAVGMLAPLIETIFHQCFLGMGKEFFGLSASLGEHERWKVMHATHWDCHVAASGDRMQKDLVRGILQLADATGLRGKLPADVDLTLSALFTYRNKMFHHGFEWPMNERERFQKHITEKKYPSDWFSCAMLGDEPWIFYMSESFVEHCLKTVDRVLDGIDAFVRDDLLPMRGKT